MFNFGIPSDPISDSSIGFGKYTVTHTMFLMRERCSLALPPHTSLFQVYSPNGPAL